MDALRELTSRRTLHQIWKWATINGIGIGVNAIIFFPLSSLGLPSWAPWIIAIIGAGSWNFIMNKKFTFKDWNHDDNKK